MRPPPSWRCHFNCLLNCPMRAADEQKLIKWTDVVNIQCIHTYIFADILCMCICMMQLYILCTITMCLSCLCMADSLCKGGQANECFLVWFKINYHFHLMVLNLPLLSTKWTYIHTNQQTCCYCCYDTYTHKTKKSIQNEIEVLLAYYYYYYGTVCMCIVWIKNC